MKYKIGNVEVEAVQWKGYNREEVENFAKKISSFDLKSVFGIGSYLAATSSSVFIISEQDFNNMATKVKEPKFKVGDKAYYIGVNDNKFDCDLVIIKKCWPHDVYDLLDNDTQVHEQELFTLEEAIEKLKKL